MPVPLHLGKSARGLQLAYRPFHHGGVMVVLVEERQEGSRVQLDHPDWITAWRELTSRCQFDANPTVLFASFDDDAEEIPRLAREHPQVTRALDLDHNTLLHAAVNTNGSCQEPGVIKAMLGAGFSRLAQNCFGATPLHWLAYKENDCAGCLGALLGQRPTMSFLHLEDYRRDTLVDVLIRRDQDACLALLLSRADGRPRLKRFLLGLHLECPSVGFAALTLSPRAMKVLLPEARRLVRNEEFQEMVDAALVETVFQQNIRDGKGPLTWLSQCVHTLLEYGANPCKRESSKSQTVLHFLARSTYPDDAVDKGLVAHLIQLGADPGVADQDGKLAADLARECGKFKTADYLDYRTKTRWEVQQMYRRRG